MMSNFDLSGAVRFDLSRGAVELREANGQEAIACALIPVSALTALCRDLSAESVLDFGHRVGTDVGRRIAVRLQGELQTATAQTLVDHLGGELALLGLGSLRLELWGRALVFAFEQSAVLAASTGDQNDATARWVAAVIEGAIARGLSRDAKVVPVARGREEVRLLVCSAAAREQVVAWLSAGCHYGEALARLNEAGGAA